LGKSANTIRLPDPRPEIHHKDTKDAKIYQIGLLKIIPVSGFIIFCSFVPSCLCGEH
jgi:hypothetical protein